MTTHIIEKVRPSVANSAAPRAQAADWTATSGISRPRLTASCRPQVAPIIAIAPSSADFAWPTREGLSDSRARRWIASEKRSQDP